MKWIAVIAVSLVWTALAFAETGSWFTTSMQIDASLVMVGIALVALLLPFLYDGSLFTRERVWQRRFDRAERKRQRYSGSDMQDIRGKAHRSL